MKGLEPWQGAIAVAVVVAVGIWVKARQEKQRVKHLRGLADELGFWFSEEEGPAFLAPLPESLFFEKPEGDAWNVLRGKVDGTQIVVFNYAYTESGGGEGSTRTVHQTLIEFRSRDLELPSFTLHPKSFLHGISGFSGSRDIRIEHCPEFSRRFRLRGSDKEAIRFLFTGEITTHYQNQRGAAVEGVADRLLLYRPGHVIRVDDYRRFIDEALVSYNMFRDASRRLASAQPDRMI